MSVPYHPDVGFVSSTRGLRRTVSQRLVWDEVNDSLDPKTFSIRNAIDRMERVGRDLVLPVLEAKPDLGNVLDQLATLMTG